LPWSGPRQGAADSIGRRWVSGPGADVPLGIAGRAPGASARIRPCESAPSRRRARELQRSSTTAHRRAARRPDPGARMRNLPQRRPHDPTTTAHLALSGCPGARVVGEVVEPATPWSTAAGTGGRRLAALLLPSLPRLPARQQPHCRRAARYRRRAMRLRRPLVVDGRFGLSVPAAAPDRGGRPHDCAVDHRLLGVRHARMGRQEIGGRRRRALGHLAVSSPPPARQPGHRIHHQPDKARRRRGAGAAAVVTPATGRSEAAGAAAHILVARRLLRSTGMPT